MATVRVPMRMGDSAEHLVEVSKPMTLDGIKEAAGKRLGLQSLPRLPPSHYQVYVSVGQVPQLPLRASCVDHWQCFEHVSRPSAVTRFIEQSALGYSQSLSVAQGAFKPLRFWNRSVQSLGTRYSVTSTGMGFITKENQLGDAAFN